MSLSQKYPPPDVPRDFVCRHSFEGAESAPPPSSTTRPPVGGDSGWRKPLTSAERSQLLSDSPSETNSLSLPSSIPSLPPSLPPLPSLPPSLPSLPPTHPLLRTPSPSPSLGSVFNLLSQSDRERLKMAAEHAKSGSKAGIPPPPAPAPAEGSRQPALTPEQPSGKLDCVLYH